jgi:hypothetical protein
MTRFKRRVGQAGNCELLSTAMLGKDEQGTADGPFTVILLQVSVFGPSVGV